MSRGRVEKGSVQKISGPERVERMKGEEPARVGEVNGREERRS